MAAARIPAVIRIVLVDTGHPGNIGACARAMKNMGLTTLVLVRPRCLPDAESEARAAGARDVLAALRVEATVDAAIADCGLVVGASARPRAAHFRVLDARAAAAELAAASRERPAAVLFGSERSGLANEELARCHALLRIPADPGYESLNLAQAVQVVCYELHLARGAATAAGESSPASAQALTALWGHLDRVLTRVGFPHQGNAAQLRPRLERLIARAVPDEAEVRILRGLLSAIEQRTPEPRE